MIIICNMTTPPTLSSTFLAHYQQCVQPLKQQWLSWQLPAALPAALRNELVSQFHLEAQSERGNQQSPSNSNCHPTTSAKRKRKKRLDFKVCRKEGWICIHTERGRGRWWPTATNSKWLQFHWASRLYRLSRLCAHWMESMSCLPEEYI